MLESGKFCEKRGFSTYQKWIPLEMTSCGVCTWINPKYIGVNGKLISKAIIVGKEVWS
jgi:hypothetical protein